MAILVEGLLSRLRKCATHIDLEFLARGGQHPLDSLDAAERLDLGERFANLLFDDPITISRETAQILILGP